jgi:hypothetical protein
MEKAILLAVASQPGFTILDPLAASLLGVFLFGEHIRTGAWDLPGQALALAVVIASGLSRSRSRLIAGEHGHPSRQHQPAIRSAANSTMATRPLAHPKDPLEPGSCQTGRRSRALSPDVAS